MTKNIAFQMLSMRMTMGLRLEATEPKPGLYVLTSRSAQLALTGWARMGHMMAELADRWSRDYYLAELGEQHVTTLNLGSPKRPIALVTVQLPKSGNRIIAVLTAN